MPLISSRVFSDLKPLGKNFFFPHHCLKPSIASSLVFLKGIILSGLYLPESLPEFERRLAAAIDTIGFMPEPNLEQIRQVSWDALCGKIVSIWNH